MDVQKIESIWKTFGYDKQFPAAFAAIGTPEFDEIYQKQLEEKLGKPDEKEEVIK